ncbi:MAG: dimethyl sulfoxide reductase anchor subunit [Candidatus Latescibacteria bacterium]|nr:dimethyl sulfoxide reductase anchor subunit [Candidatus Latescibacterota bacterium]
MIKTTPDIPGFRTENRSIQTRFHFHMDLCMGCHACEVACAEQNGLPVEVLWRRVGEVEAGTYPHVRSLFISSGCNHCLEAPCMKGCPVDAYQVNEKGIVIHLDEVCIGCQYCTWNCPYGVPVYQPDRRIVSKCDMCTHRLDEGRDPACVQACPAGAIRIETVPRQEVVENYLRDGAGPALPSPEITIPSTKITLPSGMTLADFKKVDRHFVCPEASHPSLVWMTVLTQLGLGGVATVFLVDLLRTFWGLSLADGQTLGLLAPFLIGVAGLSLGASILHLGRPVFVYRALRNWRTSWLSREVLGLGLFAGIASLYAAFLLATEGLGVLEATTLGGEGVRALLGGATVLSGGLGVYCSSMIYRVPARPAWNTARTTADFFLVALVLGPASFALAVGLAAGWGGDGSTYLPGCARAAALFTGLALVAEAALHAACAQQWAKSQVFELEACAQLYREHFLRMRGVKNLLAILALISLWPIICGATTPGQDAFTPAAAAALAALIACCLLQRHLFFVTVVPWNIPGNFLVAAHRALGKGR